jgi:hypothetical protein
MSQRLRCGPVAGGGAVPRGGIPASWGLFKRRVATSRPHDAEGRGDLLRRCYDNSRRARNGPLSAVPPLQSASHAALLHSVSHFAVRNNGGGHRPGRRRRRSQESVRHRDQRSACRVGICDPHHVDRALTGACRRGQSGCGSVWQPVAPGMACSTFLRANSR